ncbi:MAG: hypothetical protein QXS68_06660 [Candidatus Methanomethylicaceae archaeon]
MKKAEALKQKIATLQRQLRALESSYHMELGREIDRLLQRDDVTLEQVKEVVAKVRGKYY